MPVTSKYHQQQAGVSDHISSGGMISTEFIFFTNFGFSVDFLCFLFLFRYYTIFCLVSCLSLSVFLSQTSQGTTERPTPPPPFLIREFLVLTRLKAIHVNSEGFRGPNYPSDPVVRDFFSACGQRGVLINGSAVHDVKKE